VAIAGALSSIVGGVTGMMQASYQAKVANMNADIAQENADLASTKSEIDAQESDNQTAALIGEQESAQAASGVTISGKSQILTRKAARFVGAGDRMKLIQGGQIERYNFLTQKANFKAEAAAAKISGISSLIGGVLGAAGGLSGSMSSTSTATATPYKYIPRPVPKPAALPAALGYSGLNPLIRPRTSFSH